MEFASQTPPCHTILLIDDDVDLRETLADGLEAANYKVIQCGSTKNLFSNLPQMQISVAILDLMLEQETSSALIAYIKRHPRLRNTGVILVSGAEHGQDFAMRWGADLFIQKPVSITQLTAAVAPLIAQNSPLKH